MEDYLDRSLPQVSVQLQVRIEYKILSVVKIKFILCYLAFGAAAPATSGFGAFGQPAAAGSLFNSSFNKPAVPSFGGFGTPAAAPTMGSGLGLGTGGSSLFGQPAKPGGLFGQPAAPAGGLFNSSFGAANTMGQNTMGMGLGAQQQPAAIPIHQQILAMTTSPYGDNPIFKDLCEDALKPTNPAAQKAILESSASQFKISPRVGTPIRVKPVGSMISKKSLFGGLEEFDSSVEESFSLKPNAKRLTIKPKVAQSPGGSSFQSPSHHAKFSSATPELANINRTSQHSRQNTPVRNADSVSAESFRNQIPTSAPPSAGTATDAENARRVSWLHSNALEKATKQNRIPDFVLDNTIQELVTSKDVSATKSKGFSDESIIMPVRSAAQRQFNAQTSSESVLSVSRSFMDDTNPDLSLINTDPNPAGVVLQRSRYYTIPALDKLVEYLAEDGSCIVPNFTIGRTGYGNVYYNEPIDVAGLNLDELGEFIL